MRDPVRGSAQHPSAQPEQETRAWCRLVWGSCIQCGSCQQARRPHSGDTASEATPQEGCLWGSDKNRPPEGLFQDTHDSKSVYLAHTDGRPPHGRHNSVSPPRLGSLFGNWD